MKEYTIAEFKKIFQDLLDADMRLVKAQSLPTKEEIQVAEKDIGHKFASEYKDFLRGYGPIYLMAKEDVWPRPKENEVRPLWSFIYAIMILGIPSAAEKDVLPEWLNLKGNFESFNKENKIKSLDYFVPIFKWQGLSDYVGFGPDNKLYTWYYDEPGSVQPLDQTFFEFVLEETKELMKNKKRIKEENQK